MDLWLLRKWGLPLKLSALMILGAMLAVMWWEGPTKLPVLPLNFIPVFFIFETVRFLADRIYPPVAYSCKLAVRHVLSGHAMYDWTPEYNQEDYKLKRIWSLNIWILVLVFVIYCLAATVIYITTGLQIEEYAVNFNLERSIKICGWFLGFLAIADLGREYEFYTRREGKLPIKVIINTLLISLASIFVGLTLALIAQEV